MEEKYYIGTDLKFLINIEAEGFSMDDDDYEIELRCNNRTARVEKEDSVDRHNFDQLYQLSGPSAHRGTGVL